MGTFILHLKMYYLSMWSLQVCVCLCIFTFRWVPVKLPIVQFTSLVALMLSTH